MVKYTAIVFFFLVLASCGGETPDNGGESVEVGSDSLTIVDSMAYFQKEIDRNPNNAVLRYQRAVYELGQGEVEKSKLDLEMALQLDSTNLDAHLLYANLQLSMTHLDTSKFHYLYVIERDSTNTGAYVGMAKLNSLIDNFADADRYISFALKYDPYLAEAYFIRGIVYRSDFYTTKRQESWDIAMSSFQTAVEQDPEYYSAYIEMGVMQDQIGSDLALEYYNSALDIYPESVEALYNVGMYHQTRQELTQALAAYKKLNIIDSTWADPFYNQGYIHLVYTGDFDSSIYFFTKSVDIDAKYFQAYNNLGLAYELNGDIPNARKNYQKAVEINPEFQLAKDNLNSLD